jgi:sugar phosphate isomerase/epimerase
MFVMMACGGQKQVRLGSDENFVAWAFLNYEPGERTAEERAEMLKRLGFTKCGYEGHEQWIDQLEEHIIAYREHGIEMLGIYLEIREENPLEQDYLIEAIEIIKRQNCKIQLWLTIRDNLFHGIPDGQRVQKACDLIQPLADRVIPKGCKIAMYNHGGWTGLPSNQVKIVKKLQTLYNPEDVGIVLNFHHAHPFVDHFSELFAEAKPYLFLVNTNGMRVKMNDEGNKEGDPKILALGKGDHEVDMLRVVKESGYTGPVGVIDHVKQIDPEVNLRNNLNALKSILGQVDAEE